MSRGVVTRIIPVPGRKPTLWREWKAAVLQAVGRVGRIPPGSEESGACRQRGNAGTWESHLSPCEELPEDEGYRVTKSPGVDGKLPNINEPYGTQSEEADKVLGSERTRSDPRGRVGSLSGA
jgi:hypothetical protein